MFTMQQCLPCCMLIYGWPCQLVCESHEPLGHAQGRLSPGFRTRLCSSINGEEPCRLGSQCQNAHSPAELRVKAAIEMGFLPHDYKTAFCEAFLHSGRAYWFEAAVQ